MAKTLMMQGTSSHVGKSILAAALCRILWQDGRRVVPFKAQNMALNSYVTKTGGEMGRAQVVQAEAAGLEPMVEMNPVLLKPTGNACSQVVLRGKPVGNMTAQEYHMGYSLRAFGAVQDCLRQLARQFDVIVIEGAGSPAEVNLKANDIVNMRIAKMLKAPVLLIADIDRGGALAALVGTLELLDEQERDLVKGLIINKFRGDIKLLEPALEFLERKTGKPIVGVIPYLENLNIDDEDSVSLDDKKVDGNIRRELEIVVMRTPKISNFTDFDALSREPDVLLRYVGQGEALGRPDLIILPGSKNTTEDLLYLRRQGYEAAIRELVGDGTPLIGVCGGYQMLGAWVADPEHTESAVDKTDGMGLLPIATTFAPAKITHQIEAACSGIPFLDLNFSDVGLKGYEIHMGRTELLEPVEHAFTIVRRSGRPTECGDGVVRDDGLVMGTYIHGIFDNDAFRRALLDTLRQRKGLAALGVVLSSRARKEAGYNRLADAVRRNLRMDLIYKMMGE